MNTVSFALESSPEVVYWCYEDYGFVLAPRDIELPEPRVILEDVDGRDGVVDLSEWAGEVRFNNRPLDIALTHTGSLVEARTAAVALSNLLQGRRVRVIYSDEPDLYFSGRVDGFSFRAERGILTVEISLTCDPYRYRLEETIYEVTTEDVLENSRMTVIPMIQTAVTTQIRFGGQLITLSPGAWRHREIVLKQGDNPIEIVSGGPITVTYREGVL